MTGFLRVMLFESVVLLVAAEVAALAIVLAVQRRRSAGGKRAVWLALAGCAVLLVIQQLIHTDREQIQSAVENMARAIDEGDIPAIADHLDTGFTDRGLKKAEWTADLRNRLQRWHIDNAKVSGFSIQVDGNNAVAWFSAKCDWRSPEQSQAGVYSAWQLALVRREDGWKLSRVLNAKFGPGGLLDYGTILQY